MEKDRVAGAARQAAGGVQNAAGRLQDDVKA